MSGCNGLCNQGRQVCPHPLDCAQAQSLRWFNALMVLVFILSVVAFFVIVLSSVRGAA